MAASESAKKGPGVLGATHSARDVSRSVVNTTGKSYGRALCERWPAAHVAFGGHPFQSSGPMGSALLMRHLQVSMTAAAR